MKSRPLLDHLVGGHARVKETATPSGYRLGVDLNSILVGCDGRSADFISRKIL
jgi:hypothetical protein